MAVASPLPVRRGPGVLRELASGIDAIYLSGRVPLSDGILEELERRREDAIEADEPVVLMLGDQEFGLLPRAMGRYRYRLSHEFGEIGITRSERMPQLRVQPRAKLLHGVGPQEAVRWFTSRCEAAFGEVRWSVNRLDLFCDVQGWRIDGNDRDRFKSRGRQRALYESGSEFTGLQFGQRSTGTVSARIYDKTAEIEIKGTDYWFDVWGNEMDPELPVLRVEFEIRRRGLKEYSVTTPGEAFASCGGLWKSLSEEWLTFRDRTEDSTEARWPLSPVWRFVQGAKLRGSAVGLDRIRAQLVTGSVRVLVPAFVGYLAKIAQHFEVETLGEALGVARAVIQEDEERRDVRFEHRVEILRNLERFG